MTGRKVKEWVGPNPDSPVPPRVRVRVFEAHDGICYLSGRKITAADKWEIEHMQALSLGGLNVESNLAPALVEPHKKKTAIDRKIKKKNDSVRKRHLGLKKPRSTIPGSKGSKWKRKLDGTVVRRED